MAITKKRFGPAFNDANPWLTKGVHFISEGYNSEASFYNDVKKVTDAIQKMDPFSLTKMNKYWMTVYTHYVAVGSQGGADSGIHFGSSGPSSGSTALDSWYHTGNNTLNLDMAKVQAVLATLNIRDADDNNINIKTTFFSDTNSASGEQRLSWDCVFVVLIPEVTSQVSVANRTRVEAELIPGSATDPYVVATSVNGLHHQVVARGLCKIMGLQDEYEELGSATLNNDQEKVLALAPNIVRLDTPPTGTPATDFKYYEYLSPTEQSSGFTVVSNPNPSSPNSVLETKPVFPSGFEMHEGAGRQATKYYRSASDGLMRRKIGDNSLPVKTMPLEVSPLGNMHLRDSIYGIREGSTLKFEDLCKQTNQFDRAEFRWLNVTKVDSGFFSAVNNEHFVPTFYYFDDDDDPKWDYKHDLNATDGIVFKDAKIKWQDGSSTSHSNVFKRLEFVDLKIIWDDNTFNDIDLGADIAAAGGSGSAVTVQYKYGGKHRLYDFQRGHKLSINRKFPNASNVQWEYWIDITVCFRDVEADFEPGGALEAMKVFPEITFKWQGYQGFTKKVKEFQGTVKITKNPMSSGNNNNYCNFFTDSNYPQKPSIRKGQKLVDFLPWAGAYVAGFTMLYPSWSYIFEYVHTEIQNSVEHTMVIGPASGMPAKEKSRSLKYPNPEATSLGGWDYECTKEPRQGAYDNIHTHGYMGMHHKGDTSKRIMMAPFCQESCVHMHWRWGVEGTKVAGIAFNGTSPVMFKGWSKSKKKAVMGAPQIPPNQELKVKVEDSTGGSTISANKDKVISYKVKVNRPKAGCRQVIMENGFSIAYRDNWIMRDIMGLTYFEDNYTGTGLTGHQKMMQLYSFIRFLWDYAHPPFSVQKTTQMVPEGPSMPIAFDLVNL
ncbi:MAG: hypothetical protein AAF998_10065 [Bacteroidota bacterium]